ncbi:hypothetical protein LFX25_17790 [Leptospira sp. FAT2]|uniref:hypothetical protein n=1 Tax=Leptospira sanjuanensis TaxID=2879643 RepID=UPI001EE8E8D4|nr:hypothetical protein [Leptospira sanjuanensis]MCG6169696.1 hypothetical protein [Leptospira sanjuanensis]MCG6195094.1 hypothetical protein [Leptospira sanjuanensis]
MSQITGFFSDLKTSFDSLSQSIQSFLDTIGVITSFLKILFSIVPLDLFLVLIFSLVLVFLFNTISPSTSRLNYTLGVLIVSTIRSFFHQSLSQTWNLGPVLLTAFYLLIPAYSIFLLRFGLGYFHKLYQRKRALDPKNFETALGEIQKSFHGFMAKSYGELHSADANNSLNKSELKESLENLEKAVQGLKRLLETKPE